MTNQQNKANQPLTIELTKQQIQQLESHGYIIQGKDGQHVQSYINSVLSPEQELLLLKDDMKDAHCMLKFINQALCAHDDVDLQGDEVVGLKIICDCINQKLVI